MAEQQKFDPQAFHDMMKSFMAEYENSPAAKQKKMLGILDSTMNLGANIMDLGISGKQIRKSDEQLAGLKRPSLTNPIRDTALLDSQIGRAQRGLSDVSKDLAPAELANLDQYLKDIGNAKIASGGQAAIFGALGNAAAMRRRRGGLETAALGSKIKRQNRAELAGLTELDMRTKEANDRTKLGRDAMLLDQYNIDRDQANILGATGRANRRDSIYNMIPGITNAATNLGKLNFGQQSVNTPVSPINFEFQDDAAGMMNAFDEQVTGGFQDIFTQKAQRANNPYWV